MDYKFQVRASAFDFFKMSMKKTYSSPTGMCNIVFFAAAVMLTVRFYGEAGDIGKGLLIMLCLLIPVVQPIGVFLRARRLAGMVPKDMTIETEKNGLMVRVGEMSELVSYSRIKKVIDMRDCVILSLGGQSGYFLFNRVLGDRRKDFLDFIKEQMV